MSDTNNIIIGNIPEQFNPPKELNISHILKSVYLLVDLFSNDTLESNNVELITKTIFTNKDELLIYLSTFKSIDTSSYKLDEHILSLEELTTMLNNNKQETIVYLYSYKLLLNTIKEYTPLSIELLSQFVSISNGLKSKENYENIFGKKGAYKEVFKTLAFLSKEQKIIKAKNINVSKVNIQAYFKQLKSILENEKIKDLIKKEKLDLSLPLGESNLKGGLHPITETMHYISSIFISMGFEVLRGPEIDNQWNNFSALNMEEHHPARQEHDTFYIDSTDEAQTPMLLRTHTSNMQIHRMLKNNKYPLAAIAPGKVYRSDSDSTHSPMFHQIECMLVDEKEKISLHTLKNIITHFIYTYFGSNDIDMRYRHSYFPFTSPSYEVDIKQNGKWLEILGCGIIHENVLENCKIDSKKYSGIAFGLGIERLSMLKNNILDIRSMFESDIRWLKHYNYSSTNIK